MNIILILPVIALPFTVFSIIRKPKLDVSPEFRNIEDEISEWLKQEPILTGAIPRGFDTDLQEFLQPIKGTLPSSSASGTAFSIPKSSATGGEF